MRHVHLLTRRMAILGLGIVIILNTGSSFASSSGVCKTAFNSELSPKTSFLAKVVDAFSIKRSQFQRHVDERFIERLLKKLISEDYRFHLVARDLEKSDPEFLEYLSQLASVSERTRTRLAERIRQNAADTERGENTRHLLLLALGDRETISNEPAAIEAGVFRDLDPVILTTAITQMKESDRSALLRNIGAYYSKFSKGSSSVFSSPGPKRIADQYIKILLRGDNLILNSLQQGHTGLEAFKTYIHSVKQIIEVENSLSTANLMTVFGEIQNQLQKLPTGNLAPEVYIGGSFPNGRANAKTSDIDMSSNFELDAATSHEISQMINKRLAAEGVVSKLEIMATTNSENYWSVLHPVIIKVSPSKIILSVFEPNSRTPVREIPILSE